MTTITTTIMIPVRKKSSGKKESKNSIDFSANLKYRSITDLIDNSQLLGYFIDYLEACKDLPLLKCWLEIENFESIVQRTTIEQLDPNFLDVYRNRIIDTYFNCDFICSLRASGHRTFRDIQQSLAYYLTGNYLDGFLLSNYFRKYQLDQLKTTKITLLDLICDRNGFKAFIDYIEHLETSSVTVQKPLALLIDILQLLNDRLVLDSDFRLLCDRYRLLDEPHFVQLTNQLITDLKNFNCDNFQVVFRSLAIHLVNRFEYHFFDMFLMSDFYTKYLGELNDCCCKVSSAGESGEDLNGGKSKPVSTKVEKKPLFFGKIDKLGRFQTDLEPDPNQQTKSKFRKTFRKFVLFRNDEDTERNREDVAWCVAEMIVKEVTDITLRQSGVAIEH